MKTKDANHLLVVCSVAVFANGLFGDYVHDDVPAVVRNPDVQGKTTLLELFRNDFWGMRLADVASHKSYRPITIITFRIERWLLGSSHPFVSRSINVMLHAVVTLSYCHVLRRCLKLTAPQAVMSAVIFAVHPIHTEAVTGIVGRADLLSALAFLLVFYFYNRLLEEEESNQMRCVCASGVSAFVCLGILCKETAFTALLLCVLWEFRRFVAQHRSPNVQVSCLPGMVNRVGRLALMAVMLLLLRLAVMRTAPIFSKQDNPTAFAPSFKARFLTYFYLPSLNMWLLLFPWGLCHDWQLGSVPPVEGFSDLRNLASVCLFAFLIAIFCSAVKDKSGNGAALFWGLSVLVCSFLPASNLFFPVGFVVAERILYTPSLGFCAILSLGASRVVGSVGPRRGRIPKTIFIIAVALLVARTLKRNEEWGSRSLLLKSGLKTLPQNAKLHYNYANLCRDEKEPHLAIQYYIEAIRLWPDYPSAHNNLGTIYLETGKYLQAEKHFTQALRFNPSHIHAAENLAACLRNRNKTSEAIFFLRTFLHTKVPLESALSQSISADIIRLGLLLANLYSEAGLEREEEEIHLILATTFPMKADIHFSYGNFLAKQKKYDEAVRHLEAALSLDPTHSDALPAYSAVIENHFHHNLSIDFYTRALAIQWHPATATSLGKAYLKEGRLDEAAEILLRVLDNDPNNLAANVHLAQVRLQQRQYGVSEWMLREALRISPNNRQALYHLSILLASTNRSRESIQAAQVAATGCIQNTKFCASLYTHLADLMHTNAMLEPAIENYQIALHLHPSLVKALLNLGAIYHLQGNYSDAWQYYQKALEFEPSNSVVRENIWKLRKIYKQTSRNLIEL